MIKRETKNSGWPMNERIMRKAQLLDKLIEEEEEEEEDQ